jgi:hypothetical protein
MRFQLGLELRARCNRDVIVSWEQLLNLLESKNAREDLCEDVAEVILNLRDILLILDGEAY